MKKRFRIEMHHLFILVVALLIFAILFSGATGGGDNSLQEDAIVCCTFEHNGEMKTCAAVQDYGCEACEGICPT